MLNAIVAELEANVDPAYRAGVRDQRRMGAGFLGVRTSVVRKIAGRQFRQISKEPCAAVLERCEHLLQVEIYECKIIAFDWSYRCKARFEPGHFNRFAEWLHRYVTDWPDCDDLCMRSLGYLLARYPDLAGEVVAWTSSSNRWVRRAAAVSLIVGLRRGLLLQQAFAIADRLLVDGEDLVQKGYGWMLKEASKCHPDEVFDFVVNRSGRMPRTALRYAVEKLSAERRRLAMAATT